MRKSSTQSGQWNICNFDKTRKIALLVCGILSGSCVNCGKCARTHSVEIHVCWHQMNFIYICIYECLRIETHYHDLLSNEKNNSLYANKLATRICASTYLIGRNCRFFYTGVIFKFVSCCEDHEVEFLFSATYTNI